MWKSCTSKRFLILWWANFLLFVIAKFRFSCDRQNNFIGKIKARQQNSLTQGKYMKQAWVKSLQTENEAKRIFFFKPKSLQSINGLGMRLSTTQNGLKDQKAHYYIRWVWKPAKGPRSVSSLVRPKSLDFFIPAY